MDIVFAQWPVSVFSIFVLIVGIDLSEIQWYSLLLPESTIVYYSSANISFLLFVYHVQSDRTEKKSTLAQNNGKS